MPHCACASLGVHEHPVPSVEDEGGVIRMCDPALGEDLRVADRLSPTLAPANVLRQRVVARLPETARVVSTHIQGGAAAAEDEFHDVKLAATASAERLPPKHQPRIRLKAGRRHEEPLALAPESVVATAQPFLGRS
jgi:hypothetical protein